MFHYTMHRILSGDAQSSLVVAALKQVRGQGGIIALSRFFAKDDPAESVCTFQPRLGASGARDYGAQIGSVSRMVCNNCPFGYGRNDGEALVLS